jgi:hypothetical protein
VPDSGRHRGVDRAAVDRNTVRPLPDRHQEHRAHAGKRGLHRLGVGLIGQDRDLGAGQIRCASRIRHGQPLPVAARRQQRRNLPAHLTGRVSVTDQPSRRSSLRVADQAPGKTYAVDSRKAAWPVKPLTQNLHSRLWREDPLCNGSRCPSKVLGRADPRISAQTRSRRAKNARVSSMDLVESVIMSQVRS